MWCSSPTSLAQSSDGFSQRTVDPRNRQVEGQTKTLLQTTIGINLQFQGIAHHFQNLQCQSCIQFKEFFYTVFKQIRILYKRIKYLTAIIMFLLELLSCKCCNTLSGLPAGRDLHCKWYKKQQTTLITYYPITIIIQFLLSARSNRNQPFLLHTDIATVTDTTISSEWFLYRNILSEEGLRYLVYLVHLLTKMEVLTACIYLIKHLGRFLFSVERAFKRDGRLFEQAFIEHPVVSRGVSIQRLKQGVLKSTDGRALCNLRPLPPH